MPMNRKQLRFASLADATAALYAMTEPMVLTRFEAVAADRVVIAVNQAAVATGASPQPGDHPDLRRDRNLTADVELDYLYRKLIERGHARQVLAIDSRLVELTFRRVYIEGDNRVYAFVSPKQREPPAAG
jgi:hypothetical protein